MKFIPILCVATGLLGGAAQASTTNLITNGDFELGNTGFTSGLTQVPFNGGAAQYNIATDPKAWFSAFASFGDHTSGTGNMMMINGSQTVGQTVWSQTVAVAQNTTYQFGGWISALFAGSSAVTLAVNLDSLGTVTGPSTVANWDPFGFSWQSGSATSAALSILQLSTQFGGNDYALDDLSFASTSVAPPAAVIPLPAAGWALITALAALVGLRRRARA